MKSFRLTVFAITFTACQHAAASMIPLVNGGFEEPAGAKTVGDATWSNIPGWNSTGPSVDSGVESFDPAPDPQPAIGNSIAFLRSNDGAIYQTSGYTLLRGDRVTVSFYERDDFEADEVTATFYYDDGATRTPFSSQAVSLTQFLPRSGPLTFRELTAAVPPEAVGNLLGIEFENTTDDGDDLDGEWMWLDAVSLSVVPEPSAVGLFALTAIGLVARRTRSASLPKQLC